MSRLIYLQVPDSFKKQFNGKDGAFSIDPNIPIPVLIEDNTDESCLVNLSIDMIISGMLRAIEERQEKQEWIDYYCAFVLYLRPDILEICQNESKKKYNIN